MIGLSSFRKGKTLHSFDYNLSNLNVDFRAHTSYKKTAAYYSSKTFLLQYIATLRASTATLQQTH